MEPQLILVRLETQCQFSSSNCNATNSRGFESSNFTGIAKWDINHPFHLAMLERHGVLQTYTLETTGGESKAYLYPCGSFQLYIDFGSVELHRDSEGLQSHNESNNNKNNHNGIVSLRLGHGRKWNEELTRTRPIEQAWGSFEFLPQRKNEIIFFQDGSCRILFAKFPGGSPRSSNGEKVMAKIESKRSKVYCVGRHSCTILSIAVRGDGRVLVSAARDGQLRVWRICDGSMLAQTMFSRWRQPRSPSSPTEGKCSTDSSLKNDNVEDEMDQKAITIQVLSFLGKSQDLCMACPNGEVRIWNLMESENTCLKIQEVENVVAGNIMLGKDVITALALHVPDCNFPLQCSDGDTQTCFHSHEAFIAIGSMKQKLQVWNKHTMLSEWIPLWSTTLSIERVSIVSLSFRADGGLLAIAASRFTNYSWSPPSRSEKQRCDRLYLYSTSSWECVRWLDFSSNLGSCLFYQPHFKGEDRNEPNSSTSQDKVWSCRLLLVSTSGGPQTHILPEFGLMGSIQDHSENNGVEHQNCRKDTRNVHWADNKGKFASNSSRGCKKEIHQEWGDGGENEGDGTSSCHTNPSSCHTNPMGTDMRFYEKKNGCLSAMDVDHGEISSKNNNQRPMPNEEIGLQGLRNIEFQKCKAHPQIHHLKKIKTKMHPSYDASNDKLSKQKQVHEEILEPKGLAIVKEYNFKKQLPLEVVTQSCKQCKLKTLSVGFGKHYHNNALSSHSPFSLYPPPSKKDAEDNSLGDKNIAKVEECCCSTPMDTTTLISASPHQNVGEHRLNIKAQKEVTFLNPKTPEVIPNHSREKSCSSKPTISHSRKKGGKGCVGNLSKKKSSYSNHVNYTCHQGKHSNQYKTKKAERCDPYKPQSHILGGTELHELLAMNEQSSPFKDMVCMGGTFREMSPSSRPITVGAIVMNPSKTSQEGRHKLEINYPMACSTASLIQRLQEVEHETFNLEAALQMAKTKGIVLSKHDREAIRVALEEEIKEGYSKFEHAVEGQKSSARYIPLLKIPDARIARSSPFVASRKVKKKIDIKGDNSSSLQPALFDLWDLHERCPQVSSANLEQANTFTATSWRRALGGLDETNQNSMWVQREDVCRAAASAQAIYDSCLYRPDLEHQCQCHKRDQESFHVR